MLMVKLVAVGDGTVGKTTLLKTFRWRAFPTDPGCLARPAATCSDDGNVPLMFDERTNVMISPWDTAGQADFDRLRPLSYPQTDIFLLLFSLVDPALFENVRAKWVPEIRQHCPDTPFVLVGTKTDLRSDSDTMQGLADKRLAVITTEQGQEMAQQVGAAMYREISSRQLFEVDGLFHEAVDLVVGPKIRAQRQGRCCVM